MIEPKYLLLLAVLLLVLGYLFLPKTKLPKDTAVVHGNRYEQARAEKWPVWQAFFHKKGIDQSSISLFIRAFKSEELLEVWGRRGAGQPFERWKVYPFCANSGSLGPKRKEGDRQIPEGFYEVNRFNPKSKFYLSMGLDYPNAADQILADPRSPGSDIFIHGGCETVGCIPLTDDKIKELYVLAQKVRESGGGPIPVHLFPFKMSQKNLKKHLKHHPEYQAFWQQLQTGYLYFEKNKELPVFSILSNGAYHFG